MNHSSQITFVEMRRERSSDGMLFLDLAGPLRLTDAEGTDLTPRSRKAQGLLALIGTSPGLRRSRAWLQDKLWSDRGPEQGAGSLRQCLTEIRSGLGKHLDCLRTEAGWVALDPALVQVRTELPGCQLGGEVEFLEGLDIRDPEFEHWVRDQRMHYAERAGRAAADGAEGGAKRPVLAMRPASDERFGCPARPTVGLAMHRSSRGCDAEDVVSGFALDLAARSLLGHGGVDVADFRTQPDLGYEFTPLTGPDWLLHAASSVLRDRVRVTLRLSKFGEARVLWTDTAAFDLAEFYEPDPMAVDAFADRATQFVLGQMQCLQAASPHAPMRCRA